MEFYSLLRKRKADFRRFMNVYSRATGKGRGKGRAREGLHSFEWVRYEKFYYSSSYHKNEEKVAKKHFAGFVKWRSVIYIIQRNVGTYWRLRKTIDVWGDTGWARSGRILVREDTGRARRSRNFGQTGPSRILFFNSARKIYAK